MAEIITMGLFCLIVFKTAVHNWLSCSEPMASAHHVSGDKVEEAAHLTDARKQKRNGRGQGPNISIKHMLLMT